MTDRHHAVTQPRAPDGNVRVAKSTTTDDGVRKPDADETTEGPPSELGPVGRSGLNRWGGRLNEEFLTALKGTRKHKVIREMTENEPSIWAPLWFIRSLVRGVDWSATPADTGEEADAQQDEDAEFLQGVMDDMEQGWGDVIDEALSALEYGWAWHEVVFKLRRGPNDNRRLRSKFNDGRFGWRQIALRGQETLYEWDFDEDGTIMGMWQQDRYGQSEPVHLPAEFSVHFRTSKRKNNPEGRSLLRAAYKPWYRKKNFEIFEGIGAERDLAGYPILQVPPEVLQPNPPVEYQGLKSSLQDLVTQIRRDEREGALIPNENAGYKLELLGSPGNRQFDTEQLIKRADRDMMLALLMDFMLIGHENVGSFALNVSKVGMFLTGLKGILSMLQESFNTQAVPTLFRVNGMQRDAYPTIQSGDVNVRDVVEKIEALKNMDQASLLPMEMPAEFINGLLRDLGLDEVEDLEERQAQGRLTFGASAEGAPNPFSQV